MAEVTGINYYPIKSCAGTAVDVAGFSEQGILLDREWMVADENGKFMSQRGNPEMTLVQPAIEDGSLKITAPGMEELVIDLDDTEQPSVDTVVWGSKAPAIRQGAEAEAWFSEYLGQAGVQFVRKDPKGVRLIKPQYQADGATNQVAFADGASLLLASEVSLEALNGQLEKPVPMDRFRANIVVDGEDILPYEEDFWKVAKIGGLTVFVAWGCTRCPIPDTDQATGKRGKEVRKALADTRRGVDAIDPSNKGVFFGQNLLHVLEDGVTISVGDKIEIIERSENPNINFR